MNKSKNLTGGGSIWHINKIKRVTKIPVNPRTDETKNDVRDVGSTADFSDFAVFLWFFFFLTGGNFIQPAVGSSLHGYYDNTIITNNTIITKLLVLKRWRSLVQAHFCNASSFFIRKLKNRVHALVTHCHYSRGQISFHRKNSHFGGTKNGPLGARIKILRPLFNTNTPLKPPFRHFGNHFGPQKSDFWPFCTFWWILVIFTGGGVFFWESAWFSIAFPPI